MQTPRQLIDEVRAQFVGDPVYLTGSLMSAYTYDKPTAFSDVDLFVPNQQTLVYAATKLMVQGWTLDSKMQKVWNRWLRYGTKSWHTNSLRMMSPGGQEYNLVYKLTDGHAATSLAEILESFDFGMLATGWDMETDTYRDMRSYLFPDHWHNVQTLKQKHWEIALPMLPIKQRNWERGLISQYNGLREPGRYAKYAQYGYDMSLVKPTLIKGYENLVLYLESHFDPDRRQWVAIYDALLDHIKLDNFDELIEAAAQINYKDSFDMVMEALE